MAKFNAKNLGIIVFCGILLVGIVGIANAHQALPKGGDSFETAVKLEPGSYEGGAMEKGELEYFYINVKPGQEIKIEGVVEPDGAGEGNLDLYDENREKLADEGAIVEKEPVQFAVSWLPNSDKDSYKYYLKRYCSWIRIASLSFNLSLINHYDAGSQTDAGDTAEKAMEIASGEYTGYLSGKAGADTKDFYEIAVKKGETLTVKVTPPSEATMKVAVYDKDRRVLEDEYASNPGAIVTNSVPITKSGDVFVGVICDRYCSENLVVYTLNITTEGVAVEEGDEGGALIGTETGIPRGGAAEKKGPNWGLIIGIIVLVVIVAIVAYLLLKKKKQQQI